MKIKCWKIKFLSYSDVIYLLRPQVIREYNDILRQLGQVMFDTHQGRTADPEQVSSLLALADEKSAGIAELKGRISDLRQSQNCPACGAPCGKGDKFCRACGGAL